MGKVIKMAAGWEGVFGRDDLTEAIRKKVREAIEEILTEELEAALGAKRFERMKDRKGYRHGSEPRKISTGLGEVTMLVPRGRMFGKSGEREE